MKPCHFVLEYSHEPAVDTGDKEDDFFAAKGGEGNTWMVEKREEEERVDEGVWEWERMEEGAREN